MSQTARVIVYHANCHDGVTAAAIALSSAAWEGSELHEGRHDLNAAPDLERFRDKHVLFVDFAWKRPVMLEVAKVAASVLVLDHHVSAMSDLEGLDSEACNLTCVFDMERSGAGLAWDILIGGERHPLVDYVEDRDLWRFRLEGTREVHAACNSYPLTIEMRQELMKRPVQDLAHEGRAILRYHDKLVDSAVKYAFRVEIAGYDVPILQCPNAELVSDIGHRLCEGEPFAAVYVTRPDGSRVFSLRSDENGKDVSEVARLFSGGGHRNAAGFTLKPCEDTNRPWPHHIEAVKAKLAEAFPGAALYVRNGIAEGGGKEETVWVEVELPWSKREVFREFCRSFWCNDSEAYPNVNVDACWVDDSESKDSTSD